MAFTPEVQQRILVALAQKAPRAGTSKCAGCNSIKWELLDGFVIDRVVDNPQMASIYNYTSLYRGLARFAPPERRLVSVGVICQVCGNTLLFNVFKLGLDDLVNGPQLQVGRQSQAGSPATPTVWDDAPY